VSKTLWITGVLGFTGGHLRALLAKQSDELRIVGLDLGDQKPDGVDAYCQVDVNRVNEVASAARSDRPDYVIHLAGSAPPVPDADLWYANVGGTLGLLQGLAAAGCREQTRIVTIGSAAEYDPRADCPLTETSTGGGASEYGRAKWVQGRVAIDAGAYFGLSVMVARPFNLIGPGLPTRLVAGWLVQQFIRPIDEIEIGNLDTARDFVDVRDAVAAYWRVAQKGKAGEVYNVCTGRATTIKELLSLCCEITGTSPRVRVDPSRLRTADVSVSYGSHEKLYQATGWQPHYQLRDSLVAMLATAPLTT